MSKVDEATVMIVLHYETAKEMWDVLMTTYDGKSGQNKIRKLNALLELKFEAGQDYIQHAGRITAAVNDLRASGEFDWNNIHILMLLRSMPSTNEWEPTIAAIKAKEPETLTVAYTMNMLRERNEELKKSIPITLTQKYKTSPAAFVMGKNTQKCKNCNRTGHSKETCWRKGGGKVGQGPKQTFSSKNHERNGKLTYQQRFNTQDALMTLDHYTNSITTLQMDWLFDSGSTEHYVNDRNLFEKMDQYCGKMRVGNNEELDIKGKGSVTFNAYQPNGSITPITFSNVYYVPKLIANLISETALIMKKGLEQITIGTEKKWYRDNKLLMTGVYKNSYYVLRGEFSKIRYKNKLNTLITANANTWHARM
jgi:hypothetical protein